MALPYLNGHLVVVLDCRDLERSVRFWSRALGYTSEREPGAATGTYLSLLPPDDAHGRGLEILLQRTQDDKAAKNRLHLDLRTRDLQLF
ncbi:MAG TPA: VOC family protein [Trebonia sp.]|jgi:catechol 2,3-dioxygenase-like lactoylglutathione lyase family enzyme|nr:VOC family protein [Trebonia sp.]